MVGTIRLRVGGFALSRNGKDAGRSERRGLAFPQCPAEYGERRKLGFDSQWRRSRHRILLARGPGDRRGWEEMAGRIERVLTNDPGIGVARHADAGYPEAISFAQKCGVKIPMPGSESGPHPPLKICRCQSPIRYSPIMLVPNG